MGRVLLYDDHELTARYDTKTGRLDLPGLPLHRQLHAIRLAVEAATESPTMNVVVAAAGLIHGSAQHWSLAQANRKFIYQTKDARITPEHAADAKFRASGDLSGDVTPYQQKRMQIKGGVPIADRGRVWSNTILPFAFCSGARATHDTPARIKAPGGITVDTIHREDFDSDRYIEMAELFKSVHSSKTRAHFATGDNHSEFHLAFWLHVNFVTLTNLPAMLHIAQGTKIYAITIDIVSTNTICRECATKLDVLLPPGYLKDLARSYYEAQYVTTVRDDRADDQRFRPELRFLFRASAARAFSGSPVPDHVTGPINAKDTFFDGDNLVIHEAMWVPGH